MQGSGASSVLVYWRLVDRVEEFVHARRWVFGGKTPWERLSGLFWEFCLRGLAIGVLKYLFEGVAYVDVVDVGNGTEAAL